MPSFILVRTSSHSLLLSSVVHSPADGESFSQVIKSGSTVSDFQPLISMGINKLGDKSSEKEHLKLKKKKKNKAKLLNNGNVVVEEKSFPATTEKKKRKHSQKNDADIATPDENSIDRKEEKKKRKTSKMKKVTGDEVDGIDRFPAVGEDDTQKPKHKGERAGKKKKKDHTSLVKQDSRSVACEVYCISSVDVDSTKGMKKWINEYYQQRPGLKILQQRIDDFMTSHEEKEEQVRKEREALAAEGGWTVVEHHKGRKKTIEAESGTAVVSVAGAAVMDKMGKKKNKEVGVDFYRFQKREAQRNEIMMLQSKFEQDKKRIQQLRAARKFRPY